ncbi:DUF748 domain-containing protein [Azohydromonas caseinilytica]|uniref:DUF748 domain-containing protein n=1 Tax=Azohydromonas caseinilytica TaxID=2728836 RepID=A0A848F5F3_9BURK|nr:DUF748 domain-containing protein [Azohydromonas caseinilytica]NML14358.1 DUF748 domain-containing protein [Azohydromonas caseinilytica]
MFKGKRAARIAAALAIALGVLWLLGALALPPLLKWQLQQRGSALLGRELSVQSVRFTPWNLQLTLRGIALAGAAPREAAAAEPQPPQLQIERLMLNLEASSLWKRAPVLSAIEIEAPKVRLRQRADGGTDIDDMLQALRSQPQTEEPAGPPPRFALHNLRLERGELVYEDEARQVRHEVRELQLGLPFISSLPADVQTQVQPRLAFVLDGSRFDSGATTTPFSRHRDSTLELRLDALKLASLSAYLPAALELQGGQLDTRLQLRFRLEDDGTPRLDVQGQLQAQDLALADAQGQPLLGWKSLRIEVQPSQPLQRHVALGAVRLDGLDVHAGRDAQGRLLPALAPSGAPAAQGSSTKPGGAARPDDGTPAQGAWTVSVQELAVQDAALHWRDEALKLRWRVEALAAQARGLQWPLRDAMPFESSARLRPEDGTADAPAASLKLKGEAAAEGGALDFELEALPLGPLAPVLAQALRPRPEGRLGAQGRLRWTPDGLQAVELAQARLDGLRLREGERAAPPVAAWDELVLEGVRVELPRREAEIGRLRLQAPALQLARDAQGQLNAAAWFQPAAPAPAAAAQPAKSTPGADAWRLKLRQLQIAEGRVAWLDAQPAPQSPLRLEASRLQLVMQDLQWPLAAGARRASLGMQLREPGDATPARVQWSGRLQAAPLALDGRWRIERLPLHLLQAYAGTELPLRLLHAEGGFDGELALSLGAEGPRVQARGDALLAGVHVAAARDRAAGDELLSWQSLALRGLDAALQPGAKPRVQLQSATLSDFYARLVVTEQGRLNLQDLGGRAVLDNPPAGQAPKDAPADGAASAPAAAPTTREGVTVGPPRQRTRELPLDLALGTTTLVNGRIDFNDRFVRPNYSAELTELNGSLGPLRSDSPGLAPLSLRGRAAGSALLDIQGTLNPLSNPPELDLQARATGLELPPLSPYAAKYAGYAIERGKLSVELGYRIDGEGRLQASNRVVLNQLTFGERVESPSATKLPVLLAVSLLKDRNGNIDLDLPVSGSLNDPQFSIGGIILRLIGNLLLKAVTAPFALLAGAHGPDLSGVPFEPGSALPAQQGQEVLRRAAQALVDKPELQTTITGEADAAAEAEAIRRAQLEARIRAEQRKLALRGGASAQAVLPEPTPAERETLLRRLYADTPLPNKPRNFIGLARELPLAEVEQRLLAGIAVNEESARALAVQRALAVRDELTAQGVPGERLFVAAPRLHEGQKEGEPGDKEAPRWTPRVELSLR